MGTCGVPGCGRTTQTDGTRLCKTHDARKRAGRANWDGPIRSHRKRVRRWGDCCVSNCDRGARSGGLCTQHYDRRSEGRYDWDNPLEPRIHWQKDDGTYPPCLVDGCDRPFRSNGYCSRHISLLRKTGGLTPIGAPHRSAEEIRERDQLGQKRCLGCAEWQPITSFHKVRRTADGLAGRCKTCTREDNLKKAFGLDWPAVHHLLQEQENCCPICYAILNGIDFVVDHDHACCGYNVSTCGNCVRGLLCNNCNLMLGQAKDDPARLSRAMAYLKGDEIDGK